GWGRGWGTIGRSAWGPQDWFSVNPRLDSSAAFSSQSPALGYPQSPLSSSASFPADTSGGGFFELAHGVMERYDLEPAATHTHTHLHHHHAAHAHAHEHDFSSPALSLHSFDAHSCYSQSASEAGTREFDEDSNVHGGKTRIRSIP
ncbi:hypothetical protein B0H17DRAFT_1072720, partial [Mycena rosella]